MKTQKNIIVCPHCNSKLEIDFTLEQISLKRIDE